MSLPGRMSVHISSHVTRLGGFYACHSNLFKRTFGWLDEPRRLVRQKCMRLLGAIEPGAEQARFWESPFRMPPVTHQDDNRKKIPIFEHLHQNHYLLGRGDDLKLHYFRLKTLSC